MKKKPTKSPILWSRKSPDFLGNKRAQIGEDMVFFLWRIFMVTLVVLGVIMIVGTQYEKYDVRPVEAISLSKNTFECVSSNGILNLDADLGKCLQIDKTKYFAEASTKEKDVSAGSEDVRNMCKIEGTGVKIENGPFCLEQQYIMPDGKEQLNVLVGIKEEE